MVGICGVAVCAWIFKNIKAFLEEAAETWLSPQKSSYTFFPPSLTCCSCWHHCPPTENTTLYVHWFLLFTACVETLLLYSVLDKHHHLMRTSCSKQAQCYCYCKHSTHFFTQCSISSVKKHEGTLIDRFCLVFTGFCYILFYISGSDPPEQPKPKLTCQATE